MQLSKKVTLLGMATFLLTLASLTTSANSPRTFVQAGAIAGMSTSSWVAKRGLKSEKPMRG